MTKKPKANKQIVRLEKERLLSGSTIPKALIQDLRSLITEARSEIASKVNTSLIILYWKVGQSIRQHILKKKRAEYGREIIETLSLQLTEEFGSGFSPPNLSRMVRFSEIFSDPNILSTLS